MLLSELAFLAVKNAVLYDDDSFDYETFKNGDWRNSADYGLSINNVFMALNAAFSRLGALERIPHKMVDIKPVNGVITLPGDCSSVIGCGVFSEDGIITNEFNPAGINKIHVIRGTVGKNGKMTVEYKPVISFNSFTQDIDLYTTYGIGDNVCSAIIEYAKGYLTEDISPEIANMHITRAEQYFLGLPVVQDTFVQRVVRNDYKIGE